MPRPLRLLPPILGVVPALMRSPRGGRATSIGLACGGLLVLSSAASVWLRGRLLGLDIPFALASQGFALTLFLLFLIGGSCFLIVESSRRGEAARIERALSPMPLERTQISLIAWLPSAMIIGAALTLSGVLALGPLSALGAAFPAAVVAATRASIGGLSLALVASGVGRWLGHRLARSGGTGITVAIWLAFVASTAPALRRPDSSRLVPMWLEFTALPSALSAAKGEEPLLLTLASTIVLLVLGLVIFARSLGLPASQGSGSWQPLWLGRGPLPMWTFESSRLLRSPTVAANASVAVLLSTALALAVLRLSRSDRALTVPLFADFTFAVLASIVSSAAMAQTKWPPLQVEVGVPSIRWILVRATAILGLVASAAAIPIATLLVASGELPSFGLLWRLATGLLLTVTLSLFLATLMRPDSSRAGSQASSALVASFVLSLLFLARNLIGHTAALSLSVMAVLLSAGGYVLLAVLTLGGSARFGSILREWRYE